MKENKFINKLTSGFNKTIDSINKGYNFLAFKSKTHFENANDAYRHRPLYWIYNLILFVVIFGILVYACIDVKLFGEINKTPSTIQSIFYGFTHPNWSYFFGYGTFKFTDSVIYQIIETLAIAFIGTTISSILSIPFGFLASSKLVGGFSKISELLLIFIRTIPELLFGLILIRVTGFGALTGVVILSIHSIGMIGKMYAEQLDAIDDQPLEALSACGASYLAKLKYGVVPQIIPNFLSVILYRFDLNVRTASILGVVGAGGIGYSLWVYSAFNTWELEAPLVYGIIIMIIGIDILSSYLRNKLV